MDLSRARWRKSTHSGEQTNCVEVAHVPAAWCKSTHSGVESNCVEVADLGAVIAVRDSKDPDGPKLTVTPTAWQALVTALKTAAS